MKGIVWHFPASAGSIPVGEFIPTMYTTTGEALSAESGTMTEPIYLTVEQFYAGSDQRKITLWHGGPPRTNPDTGHPVAGAWRIIDWTFAEPKHCPPEWRNGTRCWRVDLTEIDMEAVQYAK